jgi:hypothetical protein
MATGRLGAVDLSSATETTVFAVTAGKTAAFSVNVCNRTTASDALVSIALAAGAGATAAEWIEFNTPVPPGGVLERTGLVLDAGKYLRASSSISSVSVVAYGYEDDN